MSNPTILGATNGIRIVEMAPSHMVPTVVMVLPNISYMKPVTITIGIETIYPKVKELAETVFAVIASKP